MHKPPPLASRPLLTQRRAGLLWDGPRLARPRDQGAQDRAEVPGQSTPSSSAFPFPSSAFPPPPPPSSDKF
eukprot:1399472-Rhodomonas_salina.4